MSFFRWMQGFLISFAISRLLILTEKHLIEISQLRKWFHWKFKTENNFWLELVNLDFIFTFSLNIFLLDSVEFLLSFDGFLENSQLRNFLYRISEFLLWIKCSEIWTFAQYISKQTTCSFITKVYFITIRIFKSTLFINKTARRSDLYIWKMGQCFLK